MTLGFFLILFLSSFIPRIGGLWIAKQSTQLAWIPNSIFVKLGAYVLMTLAVISCVGTFADSSTSEILFATSIAVVIAVQLVSKNPLVSFSVGFFTYLSLTFIF